MDLKTLRESPLVKARKKARRVGRGNGSGSGKTCGRGHKGAHSRAGWSKNDASEGGQMPLVRRIPKRGFNNKWRTEYAIVNVSELNTLDNGTEVTQDLLLEKGLVKERKDGLKILGNGDIEKKLTIVANRFSASAKTKIEAAGGSAVEIEEKSKKRGAKAKRKSRAQIKIQARKEAAVKRIADKAAGGGKKKKEKAPKGEGKSKGKGQSKDKTKGEGKGQSKGKPKGEMKPNKDSKQEKKDQSD